MLAIYHQGREIARIARPGPNLGQIEADLNLAPVLTGPKPGPQPQLGDLGLFEEAERLAKIVKWTGIGVLTLAGGVLLFKLTDLILGD